MSEVLQSWLHDDSPTKQKIVRIIFFLTSFSWTLNPLQDYMGESTPIEKLVTRMIPMLIVAAYCVTCEHRHFLNRIFRPGLWPLLWYVVFAVFCGIGGIQPALCAWKGAEIIIAVMYMCVSCRDSDSTKKELFVFLKCYEILLWVTVVLAIINPALGFRNSASIIPWIQGYLPILNPNAIGFISVLCLARLLFFPAKYKPVRILLISGTLLCSQSRTSYAVTLVILLIFIIDGLRNKQFGRVIVTFFFTVLALFMAMGWYETILRIVTRGQSAEEISTLSGRTDYWNFALQNVSLTGKGLASGSRSLILIGEDVFHKGSVNLHNSYVEALLGGGYIGAIPFAALIVINIIRQGVNVLVKPSIFEDFFLVCAVTFAARSMTSIVLAVFSADFNNMLIFWFWLYTRNMQPDDAQLSKPHSRPKPMVYEKTLKEQALENDQMTCQTLHSV